MDILKYKKSLKYITTSSLPPLVICLSVIFWFYHIQQKTIGAHQLNTIIFEPIEKPVYSVISHINSHHLITNIRAFLAFSIPVSLAYRTRYFLMIIGLILGIESIKALYYPRVVGISGVVYTMYGLALVSYLYVLYYRERYRFISTGILIVLLAGGIGRVIVDLAIITGLTSTSDIGNLSYLVGGQVSELYSPVTSVIHLSGLLVGLLTSLFFVYIDKYSLVDMVYYTN